MITVSILVPVYGVEKFIERCVTSLMEQTYPSLEYIFVDDASPDCSMDLLHKTIKKYPTREGQVRILSHDHNRGLAAARNTAFDHATGDFVYIVDSDDYIEPTTIEMMVNCQEATGADLVLANYYIHTTERVEKVSLPSFANKKELVLNMIGLNTYHSIWNKLIRRSLLEDYHIRTIEGCDVGEDLFFMTKVAYYTNSFTQDEAFTYHYIQCDNPKSYWGKLNKKFTERVAVSLMQTATNTKSFFKDKEEDYYQKAVANEFHHFYLCLSRLCISTQKNAFERISRQFYPSDTRFWPIPTWQKPIYRLAFARYYIMFMLLKMRK